MDNSQGNATRCQGAPGRSFFVRSALFILVCLAGTGCGNSPSAYPVPEFDAEASTSQVFKTYDTDADGLLDATEAASCVGLADKIGLLDTNDDGKLAPEELANRIRAWTASNTGILNLPCYVTLDGRPLSGAKVSLEPVDFLGETLIPASGITYTNGGCSLEMDPDKVPKELSRILGVQPGLYKVVITHDTIQIPSKYNKQTTLSLEVSQETILPQGVRFDLKRKKK